MSALKRINSKIQDLKEVSCANPSQRDSQITPNLEWTEIKCSSNLLNKRAHHATVIVNNTMYLYGGYETGGAGVLSDFMSFDIQKQEWKPVISQKSSIGSRHSHSLTAWKNKLYLFGGIMNTFESSNKLYSFEIGVSLNWKEQICKGEIPPPLNSHKAVVYNEQMIVFGGEEQDKYSEWMYSLNLQTNQWQKLCKLSEKGIEPRSDFSMSLYQDKLFIFGGKNDDAKYNQLWQYHIESQTFRKIETEVYLKPSARSGHSSCIYQDHLLIFGGTSGITHQRNDLVLYNIKNNFWQRHWPDEQSELNNDQDSSQNDIISRSLKKSRSNSFTKKMVCSSFGPNNEKSSIDPKLQNSKVNSSPYKKYRGPMKDQNYYNENYPFYGDKQGLLGNKHKKNDLLVDLEKETKEDFKNSQLSGSRNGRKMDLHLSQTFESLNSSILTSLAQNGGRMDSLSSNGNEERSFKEKYLRQPKPRDGHTCEVHGNRMIIFGGDRHHMSFNDVILVNLEKVISLEVKTPEKVEQNQ